MVSKNAEDGGMVDGKRRAYLRDGAGHVVTHGQNDAPSIYPRNSYIPTQGMFEDDFPFRTVGYVIIP